MITAAVIKEMEINKLASILHNMKRGQSFEEAWYWVEMREEGIYEDVQMEEWCEEDDYYDED